LPLWDSPLALEVFCVTEAGLPDLPVGLDYEGTEREILKGVYVMTRLGNSEHTQQKE